MRTGASQFDTCRSLPEGPGCAAFNDFIHLRVSFFGWLFGLSANTTTVPSKAITA